MFEGLEYELAVMMILGIDRSTSALLCEYIKVSQYVRHCCDGIDGRL